MNSTRGIWMAVALLLGIASLCTGCGGGNSGSPPPPTPAVNVSVSPASGNLLLGLTQQFTATVTGTTNTAVSWAVNGTVGGNATVGIIDGTGLYTAPADLPSSASVTITATSQADTTASGKSKFTITSDVAVSVSTNPAFTLSVPTTMSIPVIASISSQGKPDQTVTWSVNGIANGSSTVGTVSSTSSNTAAYQAPAAVPTPFTVNISATSAADTSKSGSTPMIVAGTIASVTQNISAASGGTITLPDGSSVTIAGGVLPSDQLLTLSEVSFLPNQPPNTAITNVGPALSLSFAAPVQFSSAVAAGPVLASQGVHGSTVSNAAAAFQFSVNTASNNVPQLTGSMPTANFVDSLGNNTFTGVPGNYDSTAAVATGSLGSDLLNGFSDSTLINILFAFVNLTNPVGRQSPVYGSKQLVSDPINPWVAYTPSSQSCPGSRALVLVHGMLSSVENSYPLSAAQTIQKAGNSSTNAPKYYDQVLGFDYDWLQSITVSGALLANFLDGLATACPGISVDIEAHSEGVAVSMAALAQTKSQTNTLIKHLVSLGGPIMGTPAANDLRFLQFLVLAAPNISLPIAILDLATVFSSPFVSDLQVNSPTLSQIRGNFSSATQNDAPQMIVVGGTAHKVWGVPIPNWGAFLLTWSPNNDGFIPLSSTLAFNSGLKVYPRFVDVGHTDYASDPSTMLFVGHEVQATPVLDVTCVSSQLSNCSGPRQTSFDFMGVNFGTDAALVKIYGQDSAGGVPSLPATNLIDNGGTVTWSTPLCSESPGQHSIFAFDGTLSSSNVMQTVSAGNCPLGPVGTIATVVGNGIAGYTGDNGPVSSATLNTPTGIAFDPSGNMFIADDFNSVLRRVDAQTQIITTIAGNGAPGFSGDGGPATSAQLNGPTHVVFDRSGNLFITDANNARIRAVNTGTTPITVAGLTIQPGTIATIAGTGIPGFSGDGGPGPSAMLNFPDGIALDSSDNIYVGDALNNRIREVNASTGIITTVAGNGTAGFSGDGGLAVNAELNFPSRPAFDSADNMYIADYQNNRVRKVNAQTHMIVTVAGTGITGFSGDGGMASNAQLNGPLSVTVDTSGNLYIGDINNVRIRVVNTGASAITVAGQTIQPGTIATIAGNGIFGYQGDGGPATNAELSFPTGLLLSPAGNLYFADAKNNVIRVVALQ